MHVTVDIPDWLAETFLKAGKEPSQAVLEAIAVTGYREGKFGDGGAAQILGYGTRMQVHDLLKDYDVYLNYSQEMLEQDIKTADELAKAARSRVAA